MHPPEGESRMDIRLITGAGVEDHPVAALSGLLDREDGVVWVDIPQCGGDAASVLVEVFGFHPMAIRDCVERNRVPKVHGYEIGRASCRERVEISVVVVS